MKGTSSSLEARTSINCGACVDYVDPISGWQNTYRTCSAARGLKFDLCKSLNLSSPRASPLQDQHSQAETSFVSMVMTLSSHVRQTLIFWFLPSWKVWASHQISNPLLLWRISTQRGHVGSFRYVKAVQNFTGIWPSIETQKSIITTSQFRIFSEHIYIYIYLGFWRRRKNEKNEWIPQRMDRTTQGQKNKSPSVNLK